MFPDDMMRAMYQQYEFDQQQQPPRNFTRQRGRIRRPQLHHPMDFSFYPCDDSGPSNCPPVAGPPTSRYPVMPQSYRAPYQRRDQNQQKQAQGSREQYKFKNKDNENKRSSSQNVASRNSSRAAYQVYTCPGCKEPYEFSDRNNTFMGKVPLILNCHHTVCQECIRKSLTRDIVTCPVCKTECPVPIGQPNFQDIFSPNFYIVGVVMWNKPTNSKKADVLKMVPVQVANQNTAASQADLEKSSGTQEICCLTDCKKEAKLRCNDCKENYCVDCSTVVHKSLKTMMHHKPQPLQQVQAFNAELEKCSEHGMQIELFCIKCDLSACCYCYLEKHETHEKIYLSKLEDTDFEEFKNLADLGKKILGQLLRTKKKVENLSNFNTSSIEKDICSYFADLHGLLYTIERDLRKNVTDFSTNKNFGGIIANINGNIELLRNLLAYARIAQEGTKKINLKALYQKFKEINSIPCYLVNTQGGSNEPIKFVPSLISENFADFFTVQKCEDIDYVLATEDQLPLDYEHDTSCESLLDSDFDSVSYISDSPASDSTVTTKKTADRLLEALSRNNDNKSQKSKTSFGEHITKKGKKTPLDNEKVIMTSIKSMECFYVQLKKMQSKLFQLTKEIENFVKMGAQNVTQPQINEMYLALYSTRTEQQWCRGRVVEMKNGETEPLYEVFFIDYGNYQTVDAGRLREIPAHLAQKPPFAIECKLYNQTNAAWAKNAHMTLSKLLNDKEIYTLVKNQIGTLYEVDLMISCADGTATSVNDLLLYANSNVLSASEDGSCGGSSSGRKMGFHLQLKVFSNSTKFSKNQKESVVIANVVDPHNIFIHIAAHTESLNRMKQQLKKYYRNLRSEGVVPIEGSYVVVEHRDSFRGMYHRALVKQVDYGLALAHVLLIDYGINVEVNWDQIYMLHEPFTKLETFAILVKLAHVAPYNKQPQWSSGATKFLQQYFRSQEVLKMVVHSAEPNLEVALFDSSGTADICINAQLVENNFADSTGPISSVVTWTQYPQAAPEYTEDDGFLGSLLKKADEEIEGESDLDEDDEEYDSDKQQVQIVRSESPDKIFIKFTAHQATEAELFKDLQIHYTEPQPQKDKWEVNEGCVIRTDTGYYRAKVKVVLKDGTYKVYYPDKGIFEIVNKNEMYVYDPYFNKYKQVVYTCHLANIQPAGDTGKWSYSSIEALQKIFEKNHSTFITRVTEAPELKDKKAKSSIPVHMWYHVFKVMGALVPHKEKYVSINNSLVRLGYAYKLKKSKSEDGEDKSEKPKGASVEDQSKKPKGDSAKSEEVEASKVVAEEEKSQETIDKSSESNVSVETAENKIDDEKEEKPVAPKVRNISWHDIIASDENEETDDTNTEETHDSPYRMREVVITDWPAPLKIQKREFNAYVTCAETGGYLFLHDEQYQTVYKNIEEKLKNYFDLHPPQVKSEKWLPGQMCTIAYKDYWYRGKVLKVKNKQLVTVVMIDFGSDHDMHPKDLYREILFPDVPAFASKVKLDRVYAKTGSWIASNYDKLLELITEQCKIVVKGPLEVEVPHVDVFIKDGMYLNEKLVEECPNLTRTYQVMDKDEEEEDELVVIEKEEPISEQVCLDSYKDFEIKLADMTPSRYTEDDLPKGIMERAEPMDIVGILEYNKIVLKKPGDEITDEMYALSNDIQTSVDMMPCIQDFEVGMPCVCPYEEDGIWYRAQVHNTNGVDKGFVLIFFVDFGNVESVSTKDVKMMKEEWLLMPKQTHIAIVNMDLTSEEHREHVFQHMSKLVNKRKLVKVIDTDPLTVNVFDRNGDFSYETLIQHGFVSYKE